MNIKAIKTDYSGVTFKSKTEAIFARMLDQMGYKWEYEPEFYQVGSYVPDFWVGAPLMSCVVELKPSEPTQSYKNRLFDIFTSEKYALVDGVLVCASPYGDEPTFYASKPNIDFIEERLWVGVPFTGSIEMKARLLLAKDYRFDLAGN